MKFGECQENSSKKAAFSRSRRFKDPARVWGSQTRMEMLARSGLERPRAQSSGPRKIFLDHHDAWQYRWCNIC